MEELLAEAERLNSSLAGIESDQKRFREANRIQNNYSAGGMRF